MARVRARTCDHHVFTVNDLTQRMGSHSLSFPSPPAPSTISETEDDRQDRKPIHRVDSGMALAAGARSDLSMHRAAMTFPTLLSTAPDEVEDGQNCMDGEHGWNLPTGGSEQSSWLFARRASPFRQSSETYPPPSPYTTSSSTTRPQIQHKSHSLPYSNHNSHNTYHNCSRRRRQEAVRAQCSTTHLAEISELVARMVEKEEMCRFVEGTTTEEPESMSMEMDLSSPASDLPHDHHHHHFHQSHLNLHTLQTANDDNDEEETQSESGWSVAASTASETNSDGETSPLTITCGNPAHHSLGSTRWRSSISQVGTGGGISKVSLSGAGVGMGGRRRVRRIKTCV